MLQAALLAALLIAGTTEAPVPLAREYVEDVRVEARGPVAVRSGIIQVRVTDEKGAAVHALAAQDFRLNRGEVQVLAAAEVRARPAVQFLVDLTAGPWSVRRGATKSDVQTLGRGLVSRLAHRWPDGRFAIAHLDTNGVQRSKLDGLPGEPTWTEGEILASHLPRGPDPFARPLAPLKPLFDKRLHRETAGLCPSFSGWRLAENQHFLVVISDGYCGAPLSTYTIVRNGDDCSLWPRDTRMSAEASLQRAFLADRIQPFFVRVPPRASIVSDLFGLGKCAEEPIWTRAPLEDARRLELLASTMEGASTSAGSRDEGEVADWLIDEIARRLDFYWIAWKTPEDARLGETFVKVDIEGHPGARAVPDRVGAELLLREDPYLAPYIGDLNTLPSRFREVLKIPEPQRPEDAPPP